MRQSGRHAKIVSLPTAATLAGDLRSTALARRVRASVSLLQGYAEIMEGLSPALKLHVMHVMAEKSRDLVIALKPFLDEDLTLTEYRNVRERTRQLLGAYRAELDRLHATVAAARAAGGRP